VALKAAWGFDNAEPRRFAWASMAGVLAAESVTTDVLHFHGGYGFMLEYDIQLFLLPAGEMMGSVLRGPAG
jgi:alkylation response protein AidB-like acyl-CoA dehydrogenase